jgi:alpha-galactosidase
MHDFINAHIVRGEWQYEARPVLYNNWEATFFKFNRRKLLSLARRARSLGAELFVLDDGWFRGRTSDAAGLGDYTVDRKKLPGGLASFAKKIRSLGMSFGLWFEPEMVNEDSELFRAHPEYAVTVPGKTPAKGRNQLVLDLCNPVVRDYIVDNVGRVLDETKADYVKWDFNRHLSDAYSPTLKNQGEFYHCYVLGLYDILNRIFGSRPHILFESCASGGNRFDLGMLCYSPQIWASDDTDPIERIGIQGGLSLLYPLSTMGAHVSDVPHQQTLRYTPLTTRFNISAFGCLGYELDLRYLSRVQRREIREQITFYKEHRRTFQYGRFSRSDTGTASKSNKTVWHVAARDDSEIISGLFQTLATASESPDRLTVPVSSVCADAKYVVRTRPQSLFISRFGGLVKHILPVGLDPDGVILKAINRVYRMTDCVEEYTVCGRALADGIQLNNQFMGSNYNEHTRLLGDFGSNLYVATNYDRKER